MPAADHSPTGLRTHTCGDLRAEDAGQTVRLCGWVTGVRDHGGVLFTDLRDRYGKTQVVFRPEDADLFKEAGSLRGEDCIQIEGPVCERPGDQRNPERTTGDVEVEAASLTILSRSDDPPIDVIDDVEANDEARLRHRVLDLRRRPMIAGLEARSTLCGALRRTFGGLGFLEVETPILTRATPEGARDYLVPSRVHPGRVYALPQSPQVFKQLLMVGGVDRYMQFARCFRDEDLRADRQPEFTQLDLEMSFVDRDDVLATLESCFIESFGEVGLDVPGPWPRMTWDEAMDRFGSDKPDLRFGLEIQDVSEAAGESGSRIFDGAVESGGVVRAIRLPGGARSSRKQISAWEDDAKAAGAPGLAWSKVGDGGEWTGPLASHVSSEAQSNINGAAQAGPDDLLLFGAGELRVVRLALGAVRTALGSELDLAGEPHRALWVVDFPLFEEDGEGGWTSSHHPFTAPMNAGDLEGAPDHVASLAYDAVIDGVELGSGSIRIHRREVQERVFELLGLDAATVQDRFGHLLEAFRYGAPPHGGFALGIDRTVQVALGRDGIRDVIAFPKTTSASCPLTGAPAAPTPRQAEELGLTVAEPGEQG